MDLGQLRLSEIFFDLSGFIFVVGLDESVIDRALKARFGATPAPGGERPENLYDRTGREYAKRVFQVSYSVPVIHEESLDSLLESIYAEAEFEGGQAADLRQRVRPYLDLIVVHRQVNPKEVKRFINGYILQTLIHPHLDPDAVLALQVIAFRDGWEDAYDAVNASPDIFLDALRKFREGDRSALESALPGLQLMPADLIIYLNSDLTVPLARLKSLDSYLSCMRSVH